MSESLKMLVWQYLGEVGSSSAYRQVGVGEVGVDKWTVLDLHVYQMRKNSGKNKLPSGKTR